MPRSSGRSSSSSRISRAPSRSASTAAYPARQAPPAATHAPPPAATASQPAAAQPQQPGLFANMASTAAGVAVGSTVGHTLGAGITSMFGGSSSQAPVEQAAQVQQQQPEAARSCEVDARAFTRCLDENSGNMQICDWYLQQLKSCQEAARQY